LRVGLIRAQHLPKKDLIGSADPYVIFDVDGKEQQKSKTIKNALDPEWNEEVVFLVTEATQELLLSVWHCAYGNSDELIGEVRVELADLVSKSLPSKAEITANIFKQDTREKVKGHDSRASTVTLSLSTSLAVEVLLDSCTLQGLIVSLPVKLDPNLANCLPDIAHDQYADDLQTFLS
jgi:hypothetical protein